MLYASTMWSSFRWWCWINSSVKCPFRGIMTGCFRSPGVSSLLIRSPTRVTPSWSTGGSSFYSELVFLNAWFLFVGCLCACFFFCLSPSIIKIVNCNLFTHEVLRSSYELVWTCPCVPDRIRILVFKVRGKPWYPEKSLSEQSSEPTTNSTQATLVRGECSHHCDTLPPRYVTFKW